MSRGLCASIGLIGIRHGENTAENGDVLWGSWPEGRLFHPGTTPVSA